jgi:hypothetical protein
MDAMPQVHHFSQGNPAGKRQGDVPKLLRRFARTISELGPVTVSDITFSNDVTADGLWPHFTVYFQYGEMDEVCRCGRCLSGMPTKQ